MLRILFIVALGSHIGGTSRWLARSLGLDIDSTIEQDNQGLKSMWGENHAHNIFVTLQIWLLVP